MNDVRNLDQWLSAGRADLAQRGPDALAEQRTLARWREASALQSVATARTAEAPPPRNARRAFGLRPLWFGIPVALSVCAIALIGALALVPAAEPQAVEARSTPFIALASADEIERAGPPVLFTSQVPRVTMTDYGLPVDPARADQPVDAEFLMSRTGLVLAVRFKE
jgi:hypothetical protein